MNLNLRTRLGLLVWFAIAAIAAVFALLLFARDVTHEEEVTSLLKSSQKIAWERSRAAVDEKLAAALRQVPPTAASALQLKDREGVAAALKAVGAGLRVEVQDLDRQTVYDSADDSVIRQPVLTVAAHREVVSRRRELAGLGHTPAQGFVVFRAQPLISDGILVGVVTLSQSVSTLLGDVRDALGGDIIIATLRGWKVAQVGSDLLGSTALPSAAVGDSVESTVGRGRVPIRVTSTVLLGWDQRAVAALVNVKDVAAIEERNRWFRAMVIAAVVLGAGLVALVATLYLRRAFRPLGFASTKLVRISSGDTAPDLDSAQIDNADEVGSIIAASEPLRTMVAENQLLREERERVSDVQERMIIEAMERLATNLPPERRDEIFSAIYSDDASGDSNPLTTLAKTLSHLTEQVTAAVKTKEAHARMSKELEIASRLQHSVLPKVALRHPRVSTYSTMIPAFEVGGDFYDYWLLDEDTLVMVIADVSGKGAPAALFMAITRTLLRASDARMLQENLGHFVERVNDYLSADNEQSMFVTTWLGVLKLSTGELNYVNAGHNRPLYLSAGAVEFMEPPQNMALAAMDGLPYISGRRQMNADDILVLYTDGVTEATSIEKQLFGDAALLETLRRAENAETIPDIIVKAVRAHEAGAAQADDITILAILYRGA